CKRSPNLWRTASTRAYSVNPEPKLAQAHHNATTPSHSLVELTPRLCLCATWALCLCYDYDYARHRRCTTYARAQLRLRPA
ncbi:MAG: hypothetical protein ACK53Y_01490, partial [bacterium]